MPDSRNKVDILEDQIPREFLEILLIDRTTGKNILWATDIGGHNEHDSIHIEDIVGDNGLVLRPRVRKSDEEKRLRTKKRAEVFTPSWVCNEQLNAADSLWFFGSAAPSSGSPFNSPMMGKRWKITDDDILRETFEETDKSWEQYVLEDRIEMCCGEGPYLTSRYDVVTERVIPLKQRIGILDRKLRVVNTFVGVDSNATKKEWADWIIKAYQHTYGFEWQGDNLVLTREALLYTFIDNLKAYNLNKLIKNNKGSIRSLLNKIEEIDFDGLFLEDYEYIKTVCHVISWNFWQMDGLTACPPYSKPSIKLNALVAAINKPQLRDIFGNVMPFEVPSEYCKLMDWDENKVTTYVEVYASAIKDRSYEC